MLSITLISFGDVEKLISSTATYRRLMCHMIIENIDTRGEVKYCSLWIRFGITIISYSIHMLKDLKI